jgi:hypothetical protein
MHLPFPILPASPCSTRHQAHKEKTMFNADDDLVRWMFFQTTMAAVGSIYLGTCLCAMFVRI